MLSKENRDAITALIHREVVPAVGCTEPVAVALAVAKSTQLLGQKPEKVEVALSGNMLKNAMGVGIPGTGMIGLPIAIALGALGADPSRGLEVLGGTTPEKVEEGKKFIAEGRIHVSHAEDAPDKLYIVAKTWADGHEATAIISVSHTNFILLEKDGEKVAIEPHKGCEGQTQHKEAEEHDPELNLKLVWEYATESPLDELEFILEAKKLNEEAAKKSLENGHYGHALGATMVHYGKGLFGETPVAHIIAYTSAACDARMAGAPFPVMSNSGSGNQGITATMPVVAFANDINADREHLIRALALSHLMSIYIKQSLGRLSALCGCVVASTGASCGITYLMGGGYDQVCAAVKNMVANLTGMLCDGAKPSCAMKVCSGATSALVSAMLAMNGHCCSSAEGIVCDDVDVTVHNLTSIGRDAMTETDRLVLKIMTNK